ncbi:hypothetical protein ACQPZJ_01740 [Actinoplanes sp. CA-054009]
MTVTGTAGYPVDLVATWAAYPGGPAVDPTVTTIRIVRADTGAVVLATTSTGVLEPVTGTTFYRWTPPGPVGATYLGIWTATIDGSPVTATEAIEIRSAPAAGAYAAVDDLPAPVPADAVDQLVRASRAIDQALLCAVYDPAAPAIVETLRLATLAQVADERRWARGRGGFTLGRLSVQPVADQDRPTRTGPVWSSAWAILQQAGLTGHGPQTW